MERNIKLLKFILPLNYTWFWSGIWLLYYLRFTDFTGVGLLFGITVLLGLILEIPTGAIADLFGKKKTLILAFLINGLSSLFIGLSTNFEQLFVSVIFSVVAGAFYSGTAEAILYDSLLTIKKQDSFQIRLASIEKIGLILTAVCSMLGGFLYASNVQAPWFARSIFLFLAMALCYFLKEPPIDSEKFSFKNMLVQTKQGFIQIFQKAINKGLILKLLLILSFLYIVTDVLESAFIIEIGYAPEQMGILFAVIPLISALGYHFYPSLKKRFGQNTILYVIAISIFITALASPFLAIFSGTIVLFYRHLVYPVIKIIGSNTINSQVESKYRATALSTFTLLVALPYAISSVIIGKLIDLTSAGEALAYVSILFILIFGAYTIREYLRAKI